MRKRTAARFSLFDGSNAGLELTDRPSGVQYHRTASPGQQDSLYLFGRFVRVIQ